MIFLFINFHSSYFNLTFHSFITTAKYLDTLSAVKMVTDACDLISFCWKLNQFQHLIQDCVVSMEKEYLNDLFIVLQMALNGEILLNSFNQQQNFKITLDVLIMNSYKPLKL